MPQLFFPDELSQQRAEYGWISAMLGPVAAGRHPGARQYTRHCVCMLYLADVLQIMSPRPTEEYKAFAPLATLFLSPSYNTRSSHPRILDISSARKRIQPCMVDIKLIFVTNESLEMRQGRMEYGW